MPAKTGLLFCILFCSLSIHAQVRRISGFILDSSDQAPLAGATIVLLPISDSTIRIPAVSQRNGSFIFSNIETGDYQLRASSVGYDEVFKRVSITGLSNSLGVIAMQKRSSMLAEVIIEGTPTPVKQKNDTLEYNAAAFKVNPDANADDMIKKMPGITVENGAVKAGGEDVRKVTVDGRDFFGDDATAALKNLPAEVIDKIQVFDRLSDQSRFTGFEDGNTTKSINIITRASMRNGQFGRIYAGYGTDERYSAGGNVSFFSGKRRLSLVGMANNVNQQNFSSEDLLGVTSSQSRGGGGRQNGGGGGGRPGGGGGGGGGRGGNSNFLVGQQDGISSTNAFGVNFSDLWGKNVEVAASYFFNNSKNRSDDKLSREFFLTGDSSQFYNEQNNSTTNNTNHRLNLRAEVKIDSSNTLLFTPTLSFQDNNSFNGTTGVNSVKGNGTTSQSVSTNSRNTDGYNLRMGVLYRHAFAKKGRTISVNLNSGANERKGETYLQALNSYTEGGLRTDSLSQLTDQHTRGSQIDANIAYTEPVGAKGQIQINYNPSWTKTRAEQLAWQFENSTQKYSMFDSSLSNQYDNLYTTQNGGLSYRYGDRDNMLSAGIEYQQGRLDGDQFFPSRSAVERKFTNVLPNLMFRKKLSGRSSLRIFYRTSTDPPSIDQLQEVINNSNPLFLKTGNPDLRQEYSHRLATRYTYTDPSKGLSFFGNVFLQKIQDYVGNATYVATSDSVLSNSLILYRGSQLTKPLNYDGYWSLRSFFTFGMPLKFMKSNLNWNVGYTYGKTPGMINEVSNISKTSNYNLGAVLASNISEQVDFTVSYTANFNDVKNTIQPELNNNYFTQTAGAQISLLSKSGWFIQTDINNQRYSGLTDGFNQSFWLWNVNAGKKILKNQKGELRLGVFDLLKQNRSISRTTTETYIEDLQTTVLQQYFMLTFSYRLRNFGGGTKQGR